MKVYVNENRAGFNGELLGVVFTDGVAEVSDREQTLIEMLEKYYSISRNAPAKAAAKVEKTKPE